MFFEEPDVLSIGELSRRTAVKIPTIRYYEQIGLLNPPERSEGNQRRYSSVDLERLKFVRHARDLGLSLGSIRELIEVGEQPDMPCGSAHVIAAKHLVDIQQRIRKLRRLERELKRISQLCTGETLQSCGIVQALADHRQCKGEH